MPVKRKDELGGPSGSGGVAEGDIEVCTKKFSAPSCSGPSVSECTRPLYAQCKDGYVIVQVEAPLVGSVPGTYPTGICSPFVTSTLGFGSIVYTCSNADDGGMSSSIVFLIVMAVIVGIVVIIAVVAVLLYKLRPAPVKIYIDALEVRIESVKGQLMSSKSKVADSHEEKPGPKTVDV